MELELKNISVDLSKREILKNINLKVADGEFISLLGASGCGKSTLLKTIAGIVTQKNGSVILDNKPSDKVPSYKRQTVIVFQDFRLFPHMTVAENISFPLKMIGVSKSKCREKAIELLKKVKLEGYEDRATDAMSGGQVQRVALARALAAEPKVLLLDEPFSSLDINLRKDMRNLVLELQKEYKITTILVTHDKEEALTMSDKIAFMNNGCIEQYDTPKNIFKNPVNTLVADYFSEGIYICGQVINNKFTSNFFNFNINKNDGKYKCLLRPQAIKIEQCLSGDFKILKKVYQGDNYLTEIKNDDLNLKLEAVISESLNLSEGDRVKVKLKPDKLIFIANC